MEVLPSEPIEKFCQELVTLVRVIRRIIQERDLPVLEPQTACEMLTRCALVSKDDPTGVFAFCAKEVVGGNENPVFINFLFFAYQLAARDCTPLMETMLERTEIDLKEILRRNLGPDNPV